MPQIQQNSEMKKALYQDSQENVTSKDMEVNGGFELSRKRAKPNNSEPLLDKKKIFLDTKGEKQKEKKPTSQETRRQKAAAAVSTDKLTRKRDNKVLSRPSEADMTNSTSPQKDPTDSSKEITRHTSAERILETFQSHDFTTNDWNKVADQVLTRGVQNSVEEILKSMDGASDDVLSNTPPGLSDKSGGSEVTVRRSGRQNKSKAPSRYGNPVKHSVKLINLQQDITDLNKAALEAII